MAIRVSMSGICAIVAAAGMAPSAQAGFEPQTLLVLDLSVTNRLTVITTGGTSFSTVTGNDIIGLYLSNFFTAAGSSFDAGCDSGSTFGHVGGSPHPQVHVAWYTPGGTGLNFYNWDLGNTATFTMGSQAFTGTVTFTLSPSAYNQMLTANPFGFIYFPADTANGASSADILGTYIVVPTPGVAGALAMGGVVAMRRRRR